MKSCDSQPTYLTTICQGTINSFNGLPTYTPGFYSTFQVQGTRWSFTTNSAECLQKPMEEPKTRMGGFTPAAFDTTMNKPERASSGVGGISPTECPLRPLNVGELGTGTYPTVASDRSTSHGGSVYSTRVPTPLRSVSVAPYGNQNRIVERRHGISTWQASQKPLVSNFNPDLLPREPIAEPTHLELNYAPCQRLAHTNQSSTPPFMRTHSSNSSPVTTPICSTSCRSKTGSATANCKAPLKKKRRMSCLPDSQTESMSSTEESQTNTCELVPEKRKLHFHGE